MKIRSIYKHMEKGMAAVPSESNCKIIFRHSIRSNIINPECCEKVELTNEGIVLSRWFGSNIDEEIGYIASSSCKRNIDTCKYILEGKCITKEIVIASNELEWPQAKDLELSSKVFKQYNFECTTIIHKLKTETLPGFNNIKATSKIILDYIFNTGGNKNNIDLYCTHDFQMAILYAELFDYDPIQKNIKWPMMLEGMIFWGKREHFWCAWRNEIKEFINY